MAKFKQEADSQDSDTQFDKSKVLQDARESFNATPPRKPHELIPILTRCIFVIRQGERLNSTEATELYFNITKLFQYNDKDGTLRRLMHIALTALSKQADKAYVATSSLIKDITSSTTDPATKASALRALCHISDSSTITSIERYLKQCIVDKHPEVASAALTSLIRIRNKDIIKGCIVEIQEAVKSSSPMVQFHALTLRYNLCNNRSEVARLIKTCAGGLKSPWAICQMIRIIRDFVKDNRPDDAKEHVSYIEDKLNHHNDMVKYEAADALVDIPREVVKISRKRLANVLGGFLSSSRPAVKYGAVRTLSKLADDAPSEVRELNLELENLISQPDCNRCIAILAITTLLKTGTEGSVEKILKQISEYLSELDEDFKVIVVEAVKKLCVRYPSKHAAMFEFLSRMLREEGGHAYKKAIVDTMMNIMMNNEASKEKGLDQLCEFIEDCEHTDLAVDVIHFLGNECPKMKKKYQYVRIIANRPFLDSVPVACAAIRALSKFACDPEMSENIRILLERFSGHSDYEVRDLAVWYGAVLDSTNENFKRKLIVGPRMDLALIPDLVTKLTEYLDNEAYYEGPFDMTNVAVKVHREEEKPVAKQTKQIEDHSAPPLNVFDDDISLGKLVRSSKPENLTDSDQEFQVSCVKHLYERHVVFQFNCTNTVEDASFDNVTVEVSPPPGFSVLASTFYEKLCYQETVPIYVCIEMADVDTQETVYFTDINLKFYDGPSEESYAMDVPVSLDPSELMLEPTPKVSAPVSVPVPAQRPVVPPAASMQSSDDESLEELED